jgi:hypothetical protein
MARYSRSRQKACNACSAAKTRCVAEVERCVRCKQKDIKCAWPTDVTSTQEPSPEPSMMSPTTGILSLRELLPAPRPQGNPQSPPGSETSPRGLLFGKPSAALSYASSVATHEHSLDFSRLDMACPIDATDISNRWLKPYVPDPSHKAKQYSGPITVFIYRMLKSFAATVGKLSVLKYHSQTSIRSNRHSLAPGRALHDQNHYD